MSSDHDIAVRVDNLGKRYRLGETVGGFRDRAVTEEIIGRIRNSFRRRRSVETELWALRNVTFEIGRGERVGVIGRNGAGKSTLLKLLSRITLPTEGRAETWGRVGALLEVGTGFHPELTGRENVFLSGAILGLTRKELEKKLEDIVDFAGIGPFMDTPIKRYSSGMALRLAFAIAAHIEPEILLVDEVLAVGDAEFQRKCLGRMAEIGSHGRTVVFISHNMPAVLRLCERVIVLDQGGVVCDGTPHDAVGVYLDSGSGTPAERSWLSPADAPGDEIVRLKAVRVKGSSGAVTESMNIQDSLDLEAEYWQMVDSDAPGPVVQFQVFNEDGVMLFQSADTVDEGWVDQPRRRGIVTARCHIPGNFFAEGRFFVLIGIPTQRPFRQHVLEPDVLSFHVVEGIGGRTARGPAAGNWPGVVRPLLDWTIDVRPYDDASRPLAADSG